MFFKVKFYCAVVQVDAGVADELVLGDPQAPRFVFWEGKLRPVPSSPISGITFDLMSFPGKIRAGLGAIGLKPKAPGTAKTRPREGHLVCCLQHWHGGAQTRV